MHRITAKISVYFVILTAFLALSLVSVSAANTSNFNQVINPGTLSIDIVDATYVTVANPGVTFPAINYGFACQTNTATFGTATQQIYIQNPDAADNGWVASLAGSAVTAVWDGAAADYDFNDPTGTGCTDGADASDTVGGQMTIDPSVSTLQLGSCTGGCSVDNITKGTLAAYNQGTVDSITLLNAAAASSDIGDWRLTGVAVSQKIPAEQLAGNDYDINMTLSIVAN
ncbi:MAG: hypothetical protein JNK26_04355 [Candidatus Doudnabacteria bacterium]|nr:hypothetical protein [Candidatus Doudnabacteria bacterium]